MGLEAFLESNANLKKRVKSLYSRQQDLFPKLMLLPFPCKHAAALRERTGDLSSSKLAASAAEMNRRNRPINSFVMTQDKHSVKSEAGVCKIVRLIGQYRQLMTAQTTEDFFRHSPYCV